ncbi:family 43 glycosylhydrolase [Paenibacillus sp. LMG 31458]|uniref:Family 43 glycosylhydrolase n=1 Tax=Paenibacillus phytorum TaxID=2654977 RepID=A0ABX1XW10_9BACL|nr:family 43 glycosylhydrolase [Paenibacillus phytorum]NOU72738.1 family 43 glycosylhydrolase [Paenibacillus phytorum]
MTKFNNLRTKIIMAILILSMVYPVIALPSASASALTVLFEDNFESGSTNRWTLTGAANSWSIATNDTDNAANKVFYQNNTSTEAFAIANNLSAADYAIEARVKLTDGGAYPGIVARYTDASNYYMFRVNKTSEARVELSKNVAGTSTMLAAAVPFASVSNKWYTLKMVLKGTSIRCFIDDVLVFDVTDSKWTTGKVGFRTKWGLAQFDDVKITDASNLPAAPANLTAGIVTATSIPLTWDHVADATAYRVYRSTSANGTFAQVYKGSANAFRDTGLNAQTTYYYKVSTVVSALESTFSTAKDVTTTARAAAPTGLTASNPTDHSISLNWHATSGASAYVLYRGGSASGPFTNAVYTGTDTSYVDTSLRMGQTYYYKLSYKATEENAFDESNLSEAASETTTVTPTDSDDQIPDPTEQGNIANGVPWLDTDGNVMQAHGGGVIKSGDTYYWFGEDKSHNSAVFKAVSVYASKDLIHWEFRNQALTIASDTANLTDAKIERPKVLYNEKTNKYVMWGHWEVGSNYNEANAYVAVSDTVDGNYQFVAKFRPLADKGVYEADGRLGKDNRDFTVFQDDDGTAYLISSTNGNKDLGIYQLTEDYTGVEKPLYTLYAGQRREAPAILKKDGIYYLLTSGQSGWYPNQGKYSTSTSIKENMWSDLKNFGENSTFYSQPSFIITVLGSQETSYIYAGDRWYANQLGSSQYIWLPLELNTESRTLDMEYSGNWSLNAETGIIDQSRYINASQGKTATASTESAALPSANAVDGNYATKFDTANTNVPYWWQVDLGALYDLSRIDLSFLQVNGSEMYFQYIVEGSKDGSTYTVISNNSSNKQVAFTSNSLSGIYRYIKVTVSAIKKASDNSTQTWSKGFNEVKVFATREVYEPGKVKGLTFSDAQGYWNNGKTIVHFNAPSVAGNTFKYKLSSDTNPVPANYYGDDASSWSSIVDGQAIDASNGQYIAVAEVNTKGKIVAISQGTAIVTVEEVVIPDAPTGLTAAVNGATGVALNWTAVPGAQSYNVYRADSKNGTFKKINDSAVIGTSYADIGLTLDTAYSYQVTAVNTAGESGFSNAAGFDFIVPPVTVAKLEGVQYSQWYQTPVTVTLSATDDFSGIGKTEYKLSVVTESVYGSTAPTEGFVAYTGTITLLDGVYTIAYRSVDKAGNVEADQYLQVRIDATAPVVSLNAIGANLSEGAQFENDQTLTLQVQAEDNLSGVNGTFILLDGEAYAAGTALDLTSKLGSHTVTITVTDNAGNERKIQYTFKVTTSVRAMNELLNRLEASGELTGPVLTQLENSLQQTEHQLNKGSKDKAAKHMGDFIKHLTNRTSQDHVTEHAVSILNASTNYLIALWNVS